MQNYFTKVNRKIGRDMDETTPVPQPLETEIKMPSKM